MMSALSPPWRWLLVAALMYAAVALVTFPDWTVDDAFITFRYAANLAEFGELTWNPGEDPVEGYTGVLLPLLLALAIKLGFSPLLVSKAIALLAYGISLLLLDRFLATVRVAPGVRVVALALQATMPFFFTHVLGGLETLLFTALVQAHLFALFGVLRQPGAPAWSLALTGLLAGLARPEGVVLAVAALAVAVWSRRHDPVWRRRLLTQVVLGFVLPGLVYFLLRWSYYGQFFPNPFYVKAGGQDGFVNPYSLAWLYEFLSRFLFLPWLAAGALALAARGGGELRERWHGAEREVAGCAVAAAFFVLVCSLLYLHATLAMNYAGRFFIPFYPILLTGAALLADLGAVRLDGLGRKSLALAGAAFLLGQVGYHLAGLAPQREYATWYQQLMEDEHIAIGRFLGEHLPREATLVVHVDAGAMPYYSRMRAIDMGGLNDETLSRGKLGRQRYADYFFNARAAAVVFTSNRPDRVAPHADNLMDDPRFAQYRLVKVFGTSTGRRYYQFLYLRGEWADRLFPPGGEGGVTG